MVFDQTGWSISSAARRLGRSGQQIQLIEKGEYASGQVIGRRMVYRASVEHFALPTSPLLPQQQ